MLPFEETELRLYDEDERYRRNYNAHLIQRWWWGRQEEINERNPPPPTFRQSMSDEEWQAQLMLNRAARRFRIRRILNRRQLGSRISKSFVRTTVGR